MMNAHQSEGMASQVTALAPRLLAGLTDTDTTVTNIQDLT